MNEKKYITVSCLNGEFKDVSLSLIGITFRIKDDQTLHYVDDNFGPWFGEAVLCDPKLFTIERGFFKKKSYCPDCDMELDPATKQMMQTEHEYKYEDFQPFTVRVTMPSIKCPKCGKVWGFYAGGVLSNNFGEAIVKAFESHKVKPY